MLWGGEVKAERGQPQLALASTQTDTHASGNQLGGQEVQIVERICSVVC